MVALLVPELLVVRSIQDRESAAHLVTPGSACLVLDITPIGITYGWLKIRVPRLQLINVVIHHSAYDVYEFDVYWDIIESFCGV